MKILHTHRRFVDELGVAHTYAHVERFDGYKFHAWVIECNHDVSVMTKCGNEDLFLTLLRSYAETRELKLTEHSA